MGAGDFLPTCSFTLTYQTENLPLPLWKQTVNNHYESNEIKKERRIVITLVDLSWLVSWFSLKSRVN